MWPLFSGDRCLSATRDGDSKSAVGKGDALGVMRRGIFWVVSPHATFLLQSAGRAAKLGDPDDVHRAPFYIMPTSHSPKREKAPIGNVCAHKALNSLYFWIL